MINSEELKRKLHGLNKNISSALLDHIRVELV